jgi:hypothetical protein
MVQRDWFEMPAVGGDSLEDAARPKYPVVGNALLVYRGDKVYIAVENNSVPTEMMKQPETRHLNSKEALQLEESLSFPLPVDFPSQQIPMNHVGKFGLGDLVAWFTHKLGITECAGCQKRHKWLNRVTIWGWWRK